MYLNTYNILILCMLQILYRIKVIMLLYYEHLELQCDVRNENLTNNTAVFGQIIDIF